MKFNATIQDGEIVFPNVAYARHHLSLLDGKKVWITVKKQQNARSLQQNKYYWKCLEIIGNTLGYDSDELHRLFKGMFLPKKIIKLQGKEYALAGSTTDLTVGGFVEYLMKIEAEVGKMGIRLPSAEEFKAGLDEAVLIHGDD